jgi:hypothetical protein
MTHCRFYTDLINVYHGIFSNVYHHRFTLFLVFLTLPKKCEVIRIFAFLTKLTQIVELTFFNLILQFFKFVNCENLVNFLFFIQI